LIAAGVAVLAGAGLWFAGERGAAAVVWIAVDAAALVPTLTGVARSLWRRHVGVDVVALLALAGTLAVGEYLAGAVVALMLASGRALEASATRRAAGDLRGLLSRAPRSAKRRGAEGAVESVPIGSVRADDRLLVAPGEQVPVDGELEEPAVLDESVVTGESRAVDRKPGERVASGVVNAGTGFGLRATATAEQSTYAGIVRLAEEATRRKAPVVRLADRFAALFVPFTLGLAAVAWLQSGQAVRAVAVLVVATPCPLLLAVPIAVVSGLSRAARSGVVVRDGGALEVLGRASTLLVDKTGTLTVGRPMAAETVTAPEFAADEVLRLAASVEQLSPHVLAAAIVQEANRLRLPLATPRDVREEPGTGVTGRIDGRVVRVGQLTGETPEWAQRQRQRAELDGMAIVWVSLDGVPAGALLLRDPVRPDARRTVSRLRDAGFHRLIMVTGDRASVAGEVARVVGADGVIAGCGPGEKAERVRAESARAVTVMVGDGVNDAPALAAAGVGVAIGAAGATAAAEAADAVLTVNRLERLADTVEIARHARRVALQSAAAGMGLSVVAMGFAAAGLLPPVAGAFLQEGIDVLVILNALRALGGGVRSRPLPPASRKQLGDLAAEHERLHGTLAQIRATADLIATHPRAPEGPAELRTLHKRMVAEILPHEDAEEARLCRALAAVPGSVAPTTTLSRTHVEIHRLIDRVGILVRLETGATVDPDQVPELLASLYGLDAVLRLHFAQEEEDYLSLAAPDDEPAASR
jgi:heavy metal translocating P-type ATPase